MVHAQERQRSTSKRIFDGELDQASDEVKATAATAVISHSSWESAVLTLEPIPFLDTSIFTPIQHRMVRSLARLRGYRLDDKELEEVLRTVRSRLFRANMTIAVTKLFEFIPIVPDLLSGATAYALTTAIGEVTDRYFHCGCAMASAEMKASFDAFYKESFEDAYKARRDEFRALFRDPGVRREIRDLNRARKDGKLGEDEVAQRSAEVLRRHDAH